MGVPKIPAKIFIFEEILKGTFQLSVERSIFHLEFMSVYVAALLFLTLFIIFLRIWDVARNKKHIHFNCFLTRTKRASKYEYFFRVYHNNETD